jgi:hypothetical protein
MPLSFLIDEHLRGRFTQALIKCGFAKAAPVDAVEIGGEGAPPLGTKDPPLIRWAQSHNRIIVSLDDNTLPEQLENHLAAGNWSPGIIFIRRHQSWNDVLYYLVLIAAAGLPDDYRDRCTYIPY